MVADAPTDPARLRDPSTLVFAYTPSRTPRFMLSKFRPFLEHLTSCTGRRAVLFPGHVERGASRGDFLGPSAHRRLFDGSDRLRRQSRRSGSLRGQGQRARVRALHRGGHRARRQPVSYACRPEGASCGHTSATSNSGNLAPRAFFPDQGLVPDQDIGSCSPGTRPFGDGRQFRRLDGAPVASDVFKPHGRARTGARRELPHHLGEPPRFRPRPSRWLMTPDRIWPSASAVASSRTAFPRR